MWWLAFYNNLWNAEVMCGKIQIVVVRVLLLWIAEVYTSKIQFVDVKLFAFKNFKLISYFSSKRKGFPRENEIIHSKDVFD